MYKLGTLRVSIIIKFCNKPILKRFNGLQTVIFPESGWYFLFSYAIETIMCIPILIFHYFLIYWSVYILQSLLNGNVWLYCHYVTNSIDQLILKWKVYYVIDGTHTLAVSLLQPHIMFIQKRYLLSERTWQTDQKLDMCSELIFITGTFQIRNTFAAAVHYLFLLPTKIMHPMSDFPLRL